MGGSVANLFLPKKMITKYETLRTDEKTWEDLPESESYVETGDPVIEVKERVDVGQNDPEADGNPL